MHTTDLHAWLVKNNQQGLQKALPFLKEDEKEKLFQHLQGLDLPRLCLAWKQALFNEQYPSIPHIPFLLNGEDLGQLETSIHPLPDTICAEATHPSLPQISQWRQRGLEAIFHGHVAVILLSGGQGTRLGSTLPKGQLHMGWPSQKSLFQLQAERILRVQTLARENSLSGNGTTQITWYIMTSEQTHEKLVKFFTMHRFFGLDSSQVVFFKQGEIPCFTLDGELLLNVSHDGIQTSPDGNGGMFSALVTHGLIADMILRGIQHVHVYGVDNVLIRVADPVFIGYCMQQGAACGCKAVSKRDPAEPVGVFVQCRTSTKNVPMDECPPFSPSTSNSFEYFRVIEYSELDEESKTKCHANTQRLIFHAGNIANHYFSREFLEFVCTASCSHTSLLPFHIARKKLSTVDIDPETSELVQKHVQGIKLEQFIFDVLPLASVFVQAKTKKEDGELTSFPPPQPFAILFVDRADEFSPVKNADGPHALDCPRTSCKDLMNLHRKWMEAAGGKVMEKNVQEGAHAELFLCEISPLVSYAGEGLEERVKDRLFVEPVLLE